MTIICMVVLDYVLQGVFERRFAPSSGAAAWAPEGGAPARTASSIVAASHVHGGSGAARELPLHGAAPAAPAAKGGGGADEAGGGIFADGHSHGGGGHGTGGLSDAGALALKRGAVVFIEATVCTHSVPVGLALGMQGEDTFVVLFIAVIVHQARKGGVSCGGRCRC